MKYRIDKGVKIPPRQIGGKFSQWRELIEDMEEGDSVGELTSRDSINFAAVMRKEEGIKAVSRKMVEGKIDKNDPVYRVWHDGLLEKTKDKGDE